MGSQSPRGPHQLAHRPAASQAPPPPRGPQGSTLSGQGSDSLSTKLPVRFPSLLGTFTGVWAGKGRKH